MIDFSGYTAKAIEKDMLSQVASNIDTREGSMIQTAVGPAAWYLEGMYMLLSKMQNNAYAETAVGGFLDRIVWGRGLTRKEATAAVRKGAFNVPVVSGSQFKTINGADSVIFISGGLISSSNDNYVYEMTCKTSGIIGNSYIGNLLPITAIAGLTSAVLGDICEAGTEEETDEALRIRYFETFHIDPFGGNIQAYRNVILAVNGVGAVQVYPAWKGGGTVLCSILGDDLKPALPSVVQTVQDMICPAEDNGISPSINGYGMAPIGAAVTIVTGSVLTINISCDIEFISGMQNGAELYQAEIRQKIKEYLETVNKTWGNPLRSHTINYGITVYISRVIYAILTIPEIVNVSNVLLNDSMEDLYLIETAEVQQVAELGTVVIHSDG
ncbi:MAG TPA: baseplate J protein [Lachnospiraceae bacterium]|nr:baseplate J protein [Lachnospiraceae bacterium]